MARKLKKRTALKKQRSSKKMAAKAASTKKTRYVYYFGDGKADGNGSMKPLLGGKGANLHEMTRIGLPVPPGLTITTEVCTAFYDNDSRRGLVVGSVQTERKAPAAICAECLDLCVEIIVEELAETPR